MDRQATVCNAQVVPGLGVVQGRCLGGVEAEGLGVGVDGQPQILLRVAVVRQVSVRGTQVVLGHGVVEGCRLGGPEAEGLGVGVDGVA